MVIVPTTLPGFEIAKIFSEQDAFLVRIPSFQQKPNEVKSKVSQMPGKVKEVSSVSFEPEKTATLQFSRDINSRTMHNIRRS